MSVRLEVQATVVGPGLAVIRERVDAVLAQVDPERVGWEITITTRRAAPVDGNPTWIADVVAIAEEP